MTEHAVTLKSIRKTFGAKVAVDDMHLVVPRGALYGVIGPSGAGKTTCIRMIMSILFPDSGELSVLGHTSALAAKDRIGYLPEERGVYRKMRVGAFLSYVAQLKGLALEEAQSRVPRLLERVGLSGTDRARCDELSKGMLQRVQFVGAVIHEPDLLILDEPFSGLDPVSVRTLRDVLHEEHARGATILLSTHVMAYAENLCQHVVMIHEGRKVLDEPMSGLRRQFHPRTILFEPLDPHADAAPLRAVPTVERVDAIDAGFRILLADGADPAGAMSRLATAVAPARVELARVRLEDVFVGIVSGDASGGRAGTAQALRAGLRQDGGEAAL